MTTPSYPPRIAELIAQMPLAPLGPGEPVPAAALAAEPGALFAPLRVGDADMARACQAGLYLAFDHLDESHAISQELGSAEGSYWHAIMHRREPDHGNAAYWLRRVGRHPIHAELARAAAELGYRGGAWDAYSFNDDCELHRGKGDAEEELLRRVQRAEWELLFAWCFRAAVGESR